MSTIQKFNVPDLKTRLFGKLKPFFDQNREKILLTIGVIGVVIAAFFIGRYSSKVISSTGLKELKGEINVPIKQEIKKQKDAAQEDIDETITDDTAEEGTETTENEEIIDDETIDEE